MKIKLIGTALSFGLWIPLVAGANLHYDEEIYSKKHNVEKKIEYESYNAIDTNPRRLASWERGTRGFRTVMVSGNTSGGKHDATVFSGQEKTAYKRKCKLVLTDEGDLVTYRRSQKNGKYYKTWQSGDHGGGKGHYKTTLADDGNLVTRDTDTNTVVWSTRSQDPDGKDWVCGPAKYLLFFGNGGSSTKYDQCDLSIWKWTPGCPVPGEEDSWYGESIGHWWSNYHWVEGRNIYREYQPMDYVLQKGEISYGGDFNMMLDQQCNLILFRGRDISNIRKIVWSSEDDGAEPVDPANDCHFFARTRNPKDPNDRGEMVLYKGPYKRGIKNSYEDRGQRYWSRAAECTRKEDGAYDVTNDRNGPIGTNYSCD